MLAATLLNATFSVTSQTAPTTRQSISRGAGALSSGYGTVSSSVGGDAMAAPRLRCFCQSVYCGMVRTVPLKRHKTRQRTWRAKAGGGRDIRE